MTAAEEAALRARVTRLETAIAGIELGSLLDVRRAAFSPTIGVRYTEAIRSDIADACRRLEDACREALA